MLFFIACLFVHAGIPRDDTIAQKWLDLSSLNDPEIRFQMLWSDPSEAEFIPLDLQKANARFRSESGSSRASCRASELTTLIRGHERVVEGFKHFYDEGDVKLFNLFSAGGKTNNDLPENSNYREVTPMALTIKHKDGITQMTPFPIHYERYNDPKFKRLLQGVSGGPRAGGLETR